MQSMFSFWSTEPPGDKMMDKATYHKARQMSMVGPLLKTLKRKRTDSPEALSPHVEHRTKKWKAARGEVKPLGAVVKGSGAPVLDGVADATAAGEANASLRKSSVAAEQRKSRGGPGRTEQAEANLPTSSAQHLENPDRPSSASPSSPPVAAHNGPATMEGNVDRLKRAIETQFNYEILLKHQELRLIEQELAKCQVALEQIRRCRAIPFPGSDGPSESVALGVGPALEAHPGFTTPQQPAPWGVTDGPYTRHYAHWLIPDPRFDSVVQQSTSAGPMGLLEGRVTRSYADKSVLERSRSSRTSASSRFQALPDGNPSQPKPDPLVLRRSTDGQLVRLFCAACGHSRFSNTQGFLNHCRIKHNQVFKSHDAAAIACGVPVEVDELGSVIPANEQHHAAAAPSQPSGVCIPPLVRPSTSTKMPNPAYARKLPPRPASTPSAARPPSPPDKSPVSRHDSSFSASFVPSAQTPYMSTFLSKKGFSGNLDQLVGEARFKLDLDAIEPASEDEDAVSLTQLPASGSVQPPRSHGKAAHATGNVALSRHPARTAMGPSPLGSFANKGGSGTLRHLPRLPHPALQPPVPSPFRTTSSIGSDQVIPESPPPVDLSPNTMESNPGLVSDHDDDDDEDDARSEAVPHLDSAGDFVMDDVVVEDASDVERDEERESAMESFGKAAGSSRKGFAPRKR